MTMQRTGLLVAALVGVAILLVVLIPEPTRAGHPDAEGRLEIELAIRDFEPNQLVLPAGEPLTLTFVNHSDVGHTFAFGRGTVEQSGHPAAPEEDMLEGVAVEADPFAALVAPTEEHPWTAFDVGMDETVTLQFTIPEDRTGDWELGCFTARGCYYEGGFRADVTVE